MSPLHGWVLIWLFQAPSGNLETILTFASTKEIVLSTQRDCEMSLLQQLEVNDTKWMIKHGQGRLVCVEVKP